MLGIKDVRGELVDLVSRSGRQGEFNRTFSVIRTALSYEVGNDSVRQRGSRANYQNLLESLILAQDERWRRA